MITSTERQTFNPYHELQKMRNYIQGTIDVEMNSIDRAVSSHRLNGHQPQLMDLHVDREEINSKITHYLNLGQEIIRQADEIVDHISKYKLSYKDIALAEEEEQLVGTFRLIRKLYLFVERLPALKGLYIKMLDTLVKKPFPMSAIHSELHTVRQIGVKLAEVADCFSAVDRTLDVEKLARIMKEINELQNFPSHDTQPAATV